VRFKKNDIFFFHFKDTLKNNQKPYIGNNAMAKRQRKKED
jgi:hypothetical protein